jgi:hypothetical protein
MFGDWLLSRWFLAAVLVVEASVVAWAWRTDQGSASALPTALITAEGMVLTAAVFVLGFSRDRLRRSVGEIIAQMQERQQANLKAYDDKPGGSTAMWLYEVAKEQADVALEARVLAEEPLRELIRANRRARSYLAQRDRADQLAIDEIRLSDTPGTSPTDLAEVRARRQRAVADVRETAALAGLGEYATPPGRLRAELGASFETLRLAYLFISVMVTLGLLGVVYAGWDADAWSSAEGWTLVAFVGVALAYVSVVRGDLMSEKARTVALVAEQPLAGLHYAEEYVASPLGDRAEAMSRWKILRSWADQADRKLPGLAWVQSLQGRQLLWQARADIEIEKMAPERIGRNISRNLTEAERLLRAATHRGDDPIAAVALAHILELSAKRARTARRRLSREADDLVRQAAGMFRPDVDVRDIDDFARPRGRVLARERLLAAEKWLWPENRVRTRPLTELRGKK